MIEVWNAIHGFFVSNGYVLEMLLAETLFLYSFPRRRLFFLRLPAALAVILTFSILWSTFVIKTPLTEIFKFLIYFVMFSAGTVWCMDVGVWGALFCSVGACASQHLVFRTFSLITALAGVSYESNVAVPINLGVIAVVYTVVLFAFARRIRNEADRYFKRYRMIFMSIVMFLFVFVLHCLLEPYVGYDDLPVFIGCALYGMLCSLFMLLLLYGFSRGDKLEHDVTVMEHLVHLQSEQYRARKENVELINIKCHDMKHQISMLGDRIDPEALKEIKDVIAIYDESIKTGNEVLDVFLAEKSLLCKKEDIRLDCNVEGKSLSFMNPSDLYSLFGNAIDNAIEAVRKLPEGHERLIGVYVTARMNMVAIHIENAYEGEVSFDGELPVTTKEDNRYHGYGMRSIRMIVEKYRGNMSVTAENGIFGLDIILPMI